MSYKSSFWTPKVAFCCAMPPIIIGSFLFGNISDGCSLADSVPGPLKPFYYGLAFVATLAVALLSVVGFTLCLPFTILHDAIAKVGELAGCCEIEETLYSVP